MKYKIFFSILSAIFCVSSFGQKLSNIKKMTTSGNYSNAIMSPNEKFVLLTKPNFKGVYVLDIKAKKITSINNQIGSGYGYCWSNDSKKIYYKEKKENDFVKNSLVKSYDIKSKKVLVHNKINHNYINSIINAKDSNDIIVYTNTMTLKIEGKKLNSDKSWIITNDDGQYYNPILSNDMKKVIVHKGADIFVFNSDGTGLLKKVGTGIATGWSQDDRFIIGFLDESIDGHQVSNSDLYCFDFINGNTKKITSTENLFEMYPSFYSNGNKIIFSDDKSGKIYTADITF